MKKFPFYQQLDLMDCGPTCLKMVAKYFGKTYSLEEVRKNSYFAKNGVTLLALSEAAENIGLKTISVSLPTETLFRAPLPLIAFWRQGHYLVVYKRKNNKIFVADPAVGLLKYSIKEFEDGWLDQATGKGIVLLMEPTPEFYTKEPVNNSKKSFSFIMRYMFLYKRFFLQLFLGLILSSFIQLLFPFLNQSIIDVGILQNNLGFINIILIGQLTLFVSQTIADIIRNWLLLHISSRINISIVSDFLAKIMRLPMSFFESKISGDLMQRVSDHKRVEGFLTTSSLNVVFSIVSLIVFGLVLLLYDVNIFLIFLLGTISQTVWVLFFLRKRKLLDYKLFDQGSIDQNNLVELFSSIAEIKIYNSEKIKRWNWERVQASLFRLKLKSLSLQHVQDIGSNSINQVKNILITYVSAKAALNGEITIGVMLSVQYIIGQMQLPVKDIVNFIRSWQDAKISLERMSEIHTAHNEEGLENTIDFVPNGDISLCNLSFKYNPHASFSLFDINIKIPRGKVTAIVGASGSGKTTLIKLLLKLYVPSEGKIEVDDVDLSNINNKAWREKCSAVLQSGFIFNDTIAKNIALNEDVVDSGNLFEAIKTANLSDYIQSLPMGVNTRLVGDGHGLSSGQRQRILIARAIYKLPEILFFDEATNNLDAENEKIIIDNLKTFVEGRTMIIVAHRLSTVKNADKIVVLEKGKIVEEGNHSYLTEIKGVYYNLVKNQLELGE